jgi:hypothetical protein
MDNPRFELVRHDITEPFMLRLMKYTIWLAQLAGALPIQSYKTIKTSVMGANT